MRLSFRRCLAPATRPRPVMVDRFLVRSSSIARSTSASLRLKTAAAFLRSGPFGASATSCLNWSLATESSIVASASTAARLTELQRTSDIVDFHDPHRRATRPRSRARRPPAAEVLAHTAPRAIKRLLSLSKHSQCPSPSRNTSTDVTSSSSCSTRSENAVTRANASHLATQTLDGRLPRASPK